jgi:ABC-type dipeptide/oligopeptide/nickel transport system permease subunit
MFAAFGLVTAVDLLGLGIQPPAPSFGSVLANQRASLAFQPAGLYAAGYALWICAAVFYLSADALVGFFRSKEPLVRLNE